MLWTRRGFFLAVIISVYGALPVRAIAQDATAPSAPAVEKQSASPPGPTKKDARKAESLFKRALRLQAQPASETNLPAALDALSESKELNPLEPMYATTYEFVKQRLVTKHIDQGNAYLNQGKRLEAIAQFREALELDPFNEFAKQRLNDAMAGTTIEEKPIAPVPVAYDYAEEPVLNPKSGKQRFDYRGDARQLLQTVGKAFGISVQFDDSVPARQVRFRVDEADFATAIQAARQVTGTFFVPMSESEILVAADSQDARRRLERMSLRTFVLSNAASPQELQEVMGLIRTLLDVRLISINQLRSSLTVRAPRPTLDAIAKLIEDLSAARPEVLLEINAYQLNRSTSQNLGVSLPLQFTVFNLGTEVRALLNQPGSADLINRLLNSGTISPSDAAAIAALLASQGNSPLLQPFATFGGGIFKSGLVIPGVTFNFNYNDTNFSSIQRMTLRASQGQAATFRVGDRIPVLTSQYAPLISIPGLDTNRNNLAQPIPSFNYEDLGITIKATPRVSGNSDVSLQLELQIKALAGQSFNNVPAISNREYTGSVTLKDGEPSILSGSISYQEQQAVRGLPGLSHVPLLNTVTSSKLKQLATTELLFVITPHVIRAPRQRSEATETYMEGK